MKTIRKLLLIVIVLTIFSGDLRTSYGSTEVVYKEARPRKDLQEVQKQAEYFYDPKNKPDPFAPFIVQKEVSLTQLEQTNVSEQLMKMLSLLADLKKPRTDLQRIDLSELVLTSIIKYGDQTFAMVQGPKGIGYSLKKGTFVGKNGGVVDQIISEEGKGDLGKQSIRKVIIKEPYLDQEGTLKYKETEMKMSGSIFDYKEPNIPQVKER